MNSATSTNPQDYYLEELSRITSEIVKQSGTGNCIYRGEPETYDEEPHCGKVSSTLYRKDPTTKDARSLTLLQEEILINLKGYLTEYEQRDDFEILTELQHYGTETNLIDFTSDYHVALFFACNGSHEKDGRITILSRTPKINEKYQIESPQIPRNRVLAQKSIFVRPPDGYIDFDDISIIPVPANLKQWILIHLSKYQDISTRSIFNDLHGFIRHRKLTESDEARLPLYFADLALKDLQEGEFSYEEKTQKLEPAIKYYSSGLQFAPYDATVYTKLAQCYARLINFSSAVATLTKAIWLAPDYDQAYFIRGLCFALQGDHERSIADYKRVIDLDKNFAVEAYYYRGIVLLQLENWHAAKSDFIAAEAKGMNISANFADIYESVPKFQMQFGVTLAPDIIAMLQPGEPPQIQEESARG